MKHLIFWHAFLFLATASSHSPLLEIGFTALIRDSALLWVLLAAKIQGRMAALYLLFFLFYYLFITEIYCI